MGAHEDKNGMIYLIKYVLEHSGRPVGKFVPVGEAGLISVSFLVTVALCGVSHVKCVHHQ